MNIIVVAIGLLAILFALSSAYEAGIAKDGRGSADYESKMNRVIVGLFVSVICLITAGII